jgi:formate-dependent nitrite reductase membrane component NrfD
MYTGWLFRQAKGRVLWMKRGYPAQLLVQALLAGSAALLLLSPVLDLAAGAVDTLGTVMLFAAAAELLFALFEGRLAPPGREAEYQRVARLVSHGPYAATHWLLGVLTGLVLPIVFLLVPGVPALPVLAGALALLGLWFEKDVFVRAGQALPIS